MRGTLRMAFSVCETVVPTLGAGRRRCSASQITHYTGFMVATGHLLLSVKLRLLVVPSNFNFSLHGTRVLP